MVVLRTRTELLERDAEVAQIDAALRAAAAGAGAAIVIEGPPGIGKSSLMAEAGELAGSAVRPLPLSPAAVAELFLTRRTVEMHLTGAYRKLDVSGRGDLSAALAGEPRPVRGAAADRV